MSDPVIRRVRRSIDEARNRGGMQAGMPKVTIDAADAERLCIVAEALTAPQSAEQQPVYQRCEYCDGTGDVHSIDGEWRGACDCQQPAPDVAALVEALEEIAEWAERWTYPGHTIATVALKALAAHRKGAEL